MIAEMPVDTFIAQSSQHFVRVRGPQLADLIPVLQGAGATAAPDDDGALSVVGMEASAIGDLAGAHQVVLHELWPQSASLEEAFMELTHDSVEYRGDAPLPPMASSDPHRSAEKVRSA